MAFEEDLDDFFDLDEFAVEAVLHLSVSEDRTIKAIFNDPTEGVQVFDSSVEAAAPSLQCKETDLADLRINQAVVVRSRNFKIAKLHREGTGTAIIELKTN